jgi:6-phosphogluconolactonase (cycloisomerase 2 family)
MKYLKFLFVSLVGVMMFYSCQTKNDKTHLIVGTYTSGGDGIYVYEFDPVTGDSELKSSATVSNPLYLAVSKNKKYVYAASESGLTNSKVSAFDFNNKKGEIKFKNSFPSEAPDPCYIALDDSDKFIVTGNYTGGSISGYSIKKDGRIDTLIVLKRFAGSGPDKIRQQKSHIHCVMFSPDSKYLFATDLGADQIYCFTVDYSTQYRKLNDMKRIKLPAGSGPRHLAFHPSGKYAYVITELSGDVIAYNYDIQIDSLAQFQTVKADSLGAGGSADIHITPDGKFLYTSNRLKGDGISIFKINPEDGTLLKIGYQDTEKHPRNFVITPDGALLLVACKDSNTIQIFKINQETGLLENLNKDIKVEMPACLKFI